MSETGLTSTAWTSEEIYMLADRGYGLYRQGCYQEAVVIFEGLIAVDPGNAYCRSALAAISMAAGDVRRAVSELSLILSRNPSNHEARARRCEAYCELRNWKEARQDLAILRRNGERHQVQRLTWRLEAAGVPN